MQTKSTKLMMLWLAITAVMVLMTVVIGGTTRLTNSGLSMVEWRPLIGILPPLTTEEWVRVFGLYKNSPEYIHINSGMSLDEFKTIFFWEYLHRILGRLIGLVYALPLLGFAIARKIPKTLNKRLLLLLGLGAMQGVIGWWMVKSGLVDNPHVSQYRLAIHLSIALIIFALLLWTYLDLKDGRAPLQKGLAEITLFILAITVIAGAFTAGLDGGKLYNEYPRMGEGIIPIEYGELGIWDAFNNPASAQFHHRILAIITVISIIVLWYKASHAQLHRRHAMLGMVVIQFILGLLTLLYAVPIGLGVLHQGGAAILLATVIWTAHGLNRPQA